MNKGMVSVFFFFVEFR